LLTAQTIVTLNQQTEINTDPLLTAEAWSALPRLARVSACTTLTDLTHWTARLFIRDPITVLIKAVAELIERVTTEATGVPEALVDEPITVIINEITALIGGG
jgi:hypothetical protein